MKTFEEVVNDIVWEGYCERLDEEELRNVFDLLSPEVRWTGTYWGWQTYSIWNDIYNATNKYMRTREYY